MTAPEFNIRTFTNPSGKESHRVYGMRKGKQYRKNFKDHRLALAHKQALELEAANMAAAPLVTTRLTPDQAREAEYCFERVASKGYTLRAAVEFAFAHYHPSKKQATVQEAYELFIQSKASANLRPLTVSSLANRLADMVEKFGAVQVSEVQSDELRPLIFRPDTSTVNHSNYYRAHTCFFNWCKGKYSTQSPMDFIQRPEIDRDEPQALSLAECRALVTHAQTFKQGALVPYVVLALFGGIRPTEIERLTWADVDVDDFSVNISAKVAKMRGRRIVDMSANAVEFLRPHMLKKTPFRGPGWRKQFDALKALAGFGSGEDQKAWTPDVLRHTAISMHLAKHEHEGKTATWAGNSPDVIQKHYKALVKAKDAAEFWQIMPGEKTIVKLNQPAHAEKVAATN